MNYDLNHNTIDLVHYLNTSLNTLKLEVHNLPSGAVVLDFGVNAAGGLSAGIELADICLAGLADVMMISAPFAGRAWPHVLVSTDHPVAACLYSQYAGWQVQVDDFFGMGSGPMRAAAASEELFAKFEYKEEPDCIVGVLESSKLPGEEVVSYLAEKTNVKPDQVMLLVAPTSSQAGNIQVVARSVETALHKLFELGFDMSRIASAFGQAPLPPVATDDLKGIGRTNDAILYGGQVTLWVTGDDASLKEIGPKVPSGATEAAGKPFLEIFKAANHDFYNIDPHLFSPAMITFQNLETGHVHSFGELSPEVVMQSFGLADSP